MTTRRLMLWSLFTVLLLSGNADVMAQQDVVEVDPSQQRRELWDFFSFVSLLMKVPGPPCSRPNGMPDWGPESGPRWRGCSEEASSTTSETSQTSEYSSEAAETEEGAANGSDLALQGGRLWMVVAAASVVSALVAIAMGQRRPAATQQRHGMAGSVMRRVGAVSAFAAGAFPGRQQNKTVEMQTQGEGYRLDMAPEGGASMPSATV